MQILQDILTQIYPKKASKIIQNLKSGLENPNQTNQKNQDWYKTAQVYVAYPDIFSQKEDALEVFAQKIPYIKNLGCNTIHLLPFLESPMIDAGFDIADYLKVRDGLGGNTAFDNFMSKARDENMHVLMDVILNHTSNRHTWFQNAINGEEKYRKYYIHTATKPKLIRKLIDDQATWAIYDLGGREVKIRVIFPEQAGELPHWEQAKDGYWYYHTFYPHQIDLDWQNPEVFEEFAKILIYWNQKGASFRLDAIPFVGKDILDGNTETTEFTHQVVSSLHRINKLTNPSSAFLVEAVQPIEITKQYFGTSQNTESELAYNFHLNSSLWTALISQSPDAIWDSLAATSGIPDWAQWITFLRNHDQLVLEFISDEVRKKLYKNLKPKGLSFMAGFGVAGRTANFLDENESKIGMAHALLAALPGTPALYYGDEIGQTNNLKYMQDQAKEKRQNDHNQSIAGDTRDINRGPFQVEKLADSKGKSLHQTISHIFNTRSNHPQIATSIPSKINTHAGQIFAALHQVHGANIAIYINLSDQPEKISMHKPGKTLLTLNDAYIQNQVIHLSPYGVVWIESY